MSSLSVLIIEDDPAIGTLLAEILTSLGHGVCGIETTEAGAVAAAARCRPDLIIVDAQLENGSGTAAIVAIESMRPVPHFYITGGTLQSEGPGTVVLQKPFRLFQLVRAMKQVLN